MKTDTFWGVDEEGDAWHKGGALGKAVWKKTCSAGRQNIHGEQCQAEVSSENGFSQRGVSLHSN